MSRRTALAAAIAMLATATSAVSDSAVVHAAHPGANGRIAYVAYVAPAGHALFSVESDGSDVRQVTAVGVGIEYPEWSPDGDRLVFSAGTTGPSGCRFDELWTVGADGSGLTQLTDSPDVSELDPSWSPDGSQIVFTQLHQSNGCNGTGSDADLWVIDADGTDPVQISDEPEGQIWMDRDPAWSPLGDRIAFVSDRPNDDFGMIPEIFTIAPDGSDIAKLTQPAFDDILWRGHPSWSPDGQQIAFDQLSSLTAVSEIWAMNADGTSQHAVTHSIDDVNPAWSPDGTKIAFMGVPAGGGNVIYTVNVDGTDRRAVIDVSGSAAWPTWQPVAVEPDPTDTTAPVIQPVDEVVAEAMGPSGATVTYATPVGVDDIDGAVAVQCTPTSGSTFAIGSTTVSCTASDAAGNHATATFDVRVADSTAPAINLPEAITTTATSPSGAVVTFHASTSDAVDGPGSATCMPSSGSTFAIGLTTVTCSAVDAAGNVARPSAFGVTVHPASSLPAAPAVSVVAGWGAATVTWQPPSNSGAPITGYTVTAMAGERAVASMSVGPTSTNHTFGGLTNGVGHTFVVTARTDSGSGPGGSASATPTAPRQYKPIVVSVSCPTFVAHNPNAFPVHVWWVTTRGQLGEMAIPAGTTKTLAPARRLSAIVIVAGVVQIQDAAVGTC